MGAALETALVKHIWHQETFFVLSSLLFVFYFLCSPQPHNWDSWVSLLSPSSYVFFILTKIYISNIMIIISISIFELFSRYLPVHLSFFQTMAIIQAVLLPVQCTVDSTLHWVIACLIILHDTCWTCWVGTSIMTLSVLKLIFLCHSFFPNLFVRCPCVCSA